MYGNLIKASFGSPQNSYQDLNRDEYLHTELNIPQNVSKTDGVISVRRFVGWKIREVNAEGVSPTDSAIHENFTLAREPRSITHPHAIYYGIIEGQESTDKKYVRI